MKVKEKTIDFKPITIEITFESRDEILAIWHHLNLSSENVRNVSKSLESSPYPDNWGSVSALWNELDKLKNR